jgi:hypothetical protein
LELGAFYPKIAVAYTQIATIATDDHHTLQEFRLSVGAVWPVLSDPDRTAQKDLSAPGLRQSWNAGDFSRFHGWSKRASKARRRHWPVLSWCRLW